MAFLFLFFAINAAAAVDDGWQALLHFSGSSSSIEKGSSFFLAPDGQENPAAELAATKAYLQKSPGEASCRYPARALYLKQYRPDGSELCERWRRWKEAIQAEGIELVFAAAFVNSPSSMYGHTLLKFPRGGASKGQELLDYTLSYGADTGTAGGAVYVWKGLTGGFEGKYVSAPFYLKVREYNFVENRDFWIYPLKLQPEELELLVAHAWELRDISFPYYFLRKNCAYYLLEFLEVARPGQRLTEAFPLWSVPMDTIRRLAEKNWLGEPRYRPSRYRLLQSYQEVLDSSERRAASRLADGEDAALPAGRESLVLDAAYELWRYRTEGTKEMALEKQLLQKRAAFPGPTKTFSYPKERSPEQGQPTSRLGFFGGANREHTLLELQYRGTLHDLLSHPLGYEQASELTMGDLHLRYEAKKIFLDSFEVLRIRSLSPRDSWFPKKAWSFRLAADRAKEFSCTGWHCMVGTLSGGMGLSYEMASVLFFAIGELDFEYGGVLEKNFRLGFGPSGGLAFPLWTGARGTLEGQKRWRLAGETRQRAAARLSLNQDLSRSWEFRVSAGVQRSYREGLAGFLFYF